MPARFQKSPTWRPQGAGLSEKGRMRFRPNRRIVFRPPAAHDNSHPRKKICRPFSAGTADKNIT